MKRADLIEGVSYAIRAGYTGGDDRYLSQATLVSKEKWVKPSSYGMITRAEVGPSGKHVKMVSSNGSMRKTLYVLPGQIVRTSMAQADFVKRMDDAANQIQRDEEAKVKEMKLAIQRFQNALAALGIPLPTPEVSHSKFHKKIRIDLSLDEIGAATIRLEEMADWGPRPTACG